MTVSWGGSLHSEIYTMQPLLVLSLRPVSRSVPALSNAVPPLAEGLSVSDAMESEADRMARFEGTACAAGRTFNTGRASILKLAACHLDDAEIGAFGARCDDDLLAHRIAV